MIDLKLIREQPEILRKALKDRASAFPLDELLKLDVEWRNVKQDAEQVRAQHNKLTVEIAQLKKQGKDASEKILEIKELPKKVSEASVREEEIKKKLDSLLLEIPNIPLASTPIGADSSKNVVARTKGKPKTPKFEVKPHWELAKERGLIDFERGSKLAGSRFAVMVGKAAKLERALISFMLDMHVKKGYLELLPPALVNEKTMLGSGQLPKFAEELYCCEKDKLYPIPTAEVPLVNMHANEMLEESKLPILYCAHTPCFRREAGAYGKDIKGIIRQHQFNKVELVIICKPTDSEKMLEKITNDAEDVLKKLELPYRVVELCTGDLGFASAKTYDLEVWLPSQNEYREISSCSNCLEFQARRASIRYWEKGKPAFVHTLNASGIAVGRTVVAILENFQQKDGSVKIPKALQSYVGAKLI
ncbi:MAG: serine--tRNA ligase [Candidatus Micrarchaeota archaeon]